MPSRRSIIRTILLPSFAVIVLKSFSSASAQQPEPVQFPVMSAERVAQFLEAADRKLDYLPGEVLVKFKDGVQPAGQQRALLALRSRPDAGQLEWIGDSRCCGTRVNRTRTFSRSNCRRSRKWRTPNRTTSGTCTRCRTIGLQPPVELRRDRFADVVGTSVLAAPPRSSSPSSTPASPR